MPEMTLDEMKALAMDAAWAQFTRMPSSNPGDIVHAVFRAIGPALEAALSAHPAEETDWEYRRVTPAGNPRRDAIFESPPDLDEGWTMERRAVGPWSPVPADGD